MAQNGSNHMPKPEPIWIALGVVVWAVAMALGPKRRAVFIAALGRLAAEHEGGQRVVAFGPRLPRMSSMPQSVRVAAAWLRRIVAELGAADR